MTYVDPDVRRSLFMDSVRESLDEGNRVVVLVANAAIKNVWIIDFKNRLPPELKDRCRVFTDREVQMRKQAIVVMPGTVTFIDEMPLTLRKKCVHWANVTPNIKVTHISTASVVQGARSPVQLTPERAEALYKL